ncbi:hypothetical protein [Butyrivibrio sp. NC3005]|uniref:hypothetical protein n=1 Tax=Butyrivibrio sp. NC3005 TaxID=1280685 RepID=UPI000413FB50|nr:hypothetical protein [Butyrivibrio sp. NC3005]
MSAKIPAEMQMSVSGIVRNKQGEKSVYVIFSDGKREAEGEVFSGIITSNNGFTDEEKAVLTAYMHNQKAVILDMAKNVNPLKAFLQDGKNYKKNK